MSNTNTTADIINKGVVAQVRVHKLAWFEDEKEHPYRRRPSIEATVCTYVHNIALDDPQTPPDARLTAWLGKIEDVYRFYGIGLQKNAAGSVITTPSSYTPDSNCSLVLNQFDGALSITGADLDDEVSKKALRQVTHHLLNTNS